MSLVRDGRVLDVWSAVIGKPSTPTPPGLYAIHGRGGASLLDPLGSARSHGCIRLDNSAVGLLAADAAEGTPVQID